MADKKRKLRSQHWYGGTSRDALIHRSWMKNPGIPNDSFDGRLVIGICNAHYHTIGFESIESFKAKIDDPDLDIDENSIMVLKKGIKDMVRISDARMSGTADGTEVPREFH